MTSTAPAPAIGAEATPPRLRVVIGVDTFPPDVNGAANFASRLAAGLAGRGHDVHVLCPSTTARSTTESDGTLTVHRVSSLSTPVHPTFRISRPLRASRTAEALLTELAPDVVHVQAHFVVGRALAAAARRHDIPLVATNHFMPENLHGYLPMPKGLRAALSRLGWWDLRRVLSSARTVTAPTPRAVQLLAEHGIPDAIAVSCGIDLTRFPASPAPDHLVPHVLFVGRLDEEKRVDEILLAVHRLRRTAHVRVEIVGDGKCRRAWQELAGRLGIAGDVTFHGHVDDDALLAAYRRADIFCMPGVAELQSLATMDALAAGKPVVAADAMALPHLVLPGETGWLFPPGDIAALADRLRDLIGDPAARARMGAAGRELIGRHTLDGTLDRFEALYRNALMPARRGFFVR
ncbi:glycosyltransferase [Kutzneria buriramensis]|uniref:Glycosyltransferase involved in cell wall biosynthesis n=1 Tax=Kutzneria buriramensis TaxID=1045776 RepID=A0A3E0GTW0_9PSEU|nr:glycosyltransferase [Kutzneria buriramensis]REH27682.1 glycosyltransferase involved in cell wall biosynthesis [Kutzneria buriramensis]